MSTGNSIFTSSFESTAIFLNSSLSRRVGLSLVNISLIIDLVSFHAFLPIDINAFKVGSWKISAPSISVPSKIPASSKCAKSITKSPIAVTTCKSPPSLGLQTPKGMFCIGKSEFSSTSIQDFRFESCVLSITSILIVLSHP